MNEHSRAFVFSSLRLPPRQVQGLHIRRIPTGNMDTVGSSQSSGFVWKIYFQALHSGPLLLPILQSHGFRGEMNKYIKKLGTPAS